MAEVVKPGLKAPSVEAPDSNLGSKPLEHVVGLSVAYRSMFPRAEERRIEGMAAGCPLPVVILLQHLRQIAPNGNHSRLEELAFANHKQAIFKIQVSQSQSKGLADSQTRAVEHKD